MSYRPKIMKLARIIGGLPGMLHPINEESPEYYSLAAILSDDHADVAIAAGLRKFRTMEELSKRCGKSLEETTRLAHELADKGVFLICKNEKGEEQCYIEIFAPGILERMVGNRQQLAEHPEIGRAFDEYTKKTGGNLAATLPMGSSLMRIIPIERAIDGNPKALPIEKITHYLDKYDTFSVSDCSCRAARRIMGEGCGHLETDMCLHLGPSAEYYAETGKARYITRQEAEELLRRAEENGLLHSMPNINDPGQSDSICNCCACSCFGLRIGFLFGARDAIRSNFVAEVDEEKCVACGQCVETCPGNALKLGQKLCTKEPLPPAPAYKKITHSSWSEKDWDYDYRENREDTVATGTAPCKTACPAHIAVQGYLRLAAQGRYRDALALIKKENPFPAICGRVCNKRCEDACTRATIDEAVAIDEVKRFIADQDLKAETRYVPPMVNQIGEPYPEKIAIIGAGPAGLSCAFYLAQKGYSPMVFDKAARPGGMMMNGIPSFRLEKDVVQAEIDILTEMGVQFRCGVEVGKDVTIAQLREQGYKGFYLAIGAQGGRKANVPGEDAVGVQLGVEFVTAVNLGQAEKLQGRTVVIGGGNVAVDVARTAIRYGSDTVGMFCLESRDMMPADRDEVAEAEEEGIVVGCGWGPKEILSENGRVAGVVFKKCLSVFDAEGRFSPVYDENELRTVECENVLLSIGQSILWGDLLAGTGVELNPNGTVKADPVTYQTAEPDIFVGGDVYTGPKFAIDAIAAGKEGAISLHRWVHEGQTLTLGRDRRIYRALDKENALFSADGFDNTPRQKPGYNAAKAKTFGDSRVTFTEEQIRKETARCLGCGATKVDPYMCVGCGLCVTRCAFDAIHLDKKFDAWGTAFEKLPLAVAGHVVKRTINIAAGAIKRTK